MYSTITSVPSRHRVSHQHHTCACLMSAIVKYFNFYKVVYYNIVILVSPSRQAMDKQAAAERERRKKVLDAEGDKKYVHAVLCAYCAMYI